MSETLQGHRTNKQHKKVRNADSQ